MNKFKNINDLLNRFRKIIISIYFIIKLFLLIFSFYVLLFLNFFNLQGENVKWSFSESSFHTIIVYLFLNIIIISIFSMISWILNTIIYKFIKFKYKKNTIIDIILFSIISLTFYILHFS